MRMYEIVEDGAEFIVRDFVTDDGGGEYDVHEIRFYSRERAENYIKNMRKVASDRWRSE